MLDQLRRDITTRLDELVGEADKLRRALTALSPHRRNGTPTTAARTTATPTRSSPPKPRSATTKTKAGSSPRTPPGATKAAVLAALAGGEAMTATEISHLTGLPAATVSTTLSRLAKAGEITKADRGYQAKPPAARTSTGHGGTVAPK